MFDVLQTSFNEARSPDLAYLSNQIANNWYSTVSHYPEIRIFNADTFLSNLPQDVVNTVVFRATSVRPPHGCHIGDPVYDGEDITCCPIQCPGKQSVCVNNFFTKTFKLKAQLLRCIFLSHQPLTISHIFFPNTDHPLLETCPSSFGTLFSEGDTWEECIPGIACCSLSCECVRIDGRLSRQCQERWVFKQTNHCFCSFLFSMKSAHWSTLHNQ